MLSDEDIKNLDEWIENETDDSLKGFMIMLGIASGACKLSINELGPKDSNKVIDLENEIKNNTEKINYLIESGRLSDITEESKNKYKTLSKEEFDFWIPDKYRSLFDDKDIG